MGEGRIVIKLKEKSSIFWDDLGKLLINNFSLHNLKYSGPQGTILEFDYFEHDDEIEFLQAFIELFKFLKTDDIETFEIVGGLKPYVSKLKPALQKKYYKLLKPLK